MFETVFYVFLFYRHRAARGRNFLADDRLICNFAYICKITFQDDFLCNFVNIFSNLSYIK